jgi:phosphopantothenoylcysteine synthetase/decarboxylase
MTRVLYLVVCAAPPAAAIGELVDLLVPAWTVCVITTPNAVEWVDEEALAAKSGQSTRHEHRRPDDTENLPKAGAVAVVPATFNTVNKWAAGISDTFALGVLNESIGLRLPVVVAPYAKATLAAHPAFDDSLRRIAGWGVTVLPNEAIRTSTGRFDWEPVTSALSRVQRTFPNSTAAPPSVDP